MGGRGLPGGTSPDSLVPVIARRIGIEKRGDSFALFVSIDGEPMHQFGPPIQLHLDGPFCVGIGFCSHLPDKSDTAVLSNIVLKNASGKVHYCLRVLWAPKSSRNESRENQGITGSSGIVKR